eukprot:3861795-Amphidinium_carterae.1
MKVDSGGRLFTSSQELTLQPKSPGATSVSSVLRSVPHWTTSRRTWFGPVFARSETVRRVRLLMQLCHIIRTTVCKVLIGGPCAASSLLAGPRIWSLSRLYDGPPIACAVVKALRVEYQQLMLDLACRSARWSIAEKLQCAVIITNVRVSSSTLLDGSSTMACVRQSPI